MYIANWVPIYPLICHPISYPSYVCVYFVCQNPFWLQFVVKKNIEKYFWIVPRMTQESIEILISTVVFQRLPTCSSLWCRAVRSGKPSVQLGASSVLTKISSQYVSYTQSSQTSCKNDGSFTAYNARSYVQLYTVCGLCALRVGWLTALPDLSHYVNAAVSLHRYQVVAL